MSEYLLLPPSPRTIGQDLPMSYLNNGSKQEVGGFLTYRDDDPYAVALTLNNDRVWEFSRSLIFDCLEGQSSGDINAGNVLFGPADPEDPYCEVDLALKEFDEHEQPVLHHLVVSSYGLRRFWSHSVSVVRQGGESRLMEPIVSETAAMFKMLYDNYRRG